MLEFGLLKKIMYPKARYLIVGDRGITIEFGNEVSEEVNNQVRRMTWALGTYNIPGIVEFFPTFRSVSVLYDPFRIKTRDLIWELKKMEASMASMPPPPSRAFEIPVVYGEEYSEDLEKIAKFLNLTPEEFVRIHSSPIYLVFMNGALGGTAFIKMPQWLASLPRKKTPALWMPAGVVMMAGGLGCLFKAMDGPSGWNVIGKSPLKQWFPERDPPLLISAGDKVQYRPIDKKEYQETKRMVEEGRYQIRMLELRESSLAEYEKKEVKKNGKSKKVGDIFSGDLAPFDVFHDSPISDQRPGSKISNSTR